MATRLVRPAMVVKARRWASRPGPRRLNLGCGATKVAGWANVDFLGRTRLDFALDLRKRLPFPDDSIDAIFHEHALDYLEYPQAERLVQECARVVRPGGVLRIALPDFLRYADAYVHRTSFLEERRPDAPTPLLALAQIAYGYNHRSIWDAETLVYLLSACGLDAEERSYRDSRIEPPPDSDRLARVSETIYVEAVKPPIARGTRAVAVPLRRRSRAQRPRAARGDRVHAR
jgi:predicted SAM-dependent methyltransferase